MRKFYGMVTCVTMCMMLAACGNVTQSGAEDGSTQSEYVVRANAEASGETTSTVEQESLKNPAKEEETTSKKTEENASSLGVESETKNVEVNGSDVTEESTEAITQKATEKATESVTQKATEKATETVTQKATEKATETATQKATQEVTEVVTQKATQEVTEIVTQKATQETTEAPTQATVSGNTESSTKVPTEPSNVNEIQPADEIPTEPVTEVPTEAPTEAPTLSEMEMRIANNVWVYSEYIQRVIGLVNAQRKENGLPMLQYDATLCKIATHRCFENVDNNMFDHMRPNGTPCFTIFGEYGLSYAAAAENIAAGQTTPEQVMDAWMNSPGHRENILGDYSHIGVGVAVDASGCIYWTQSFIKY